MRSCCIHRLAVGAAAAMRDPGAAAGAHHRLQRRDQAAGGRLQIDPAVVASVVDIGLAVGDDDDFGARQGARQQVVQRLGRPFDLRRLGGRPADLQILAAAAGSGDPAGCGRARRSDRPAPGAQVVRPPAARRRIQPRSTTIARMVAMPATMIATPKRLAMI